MTEVQHVAERYSSEVKFAKLAEHEFRFISDKSLKLESNSCDKDDSYVSDGETSVSAESDTVPSARSIDSPLVHSADASPIIHSSIEVELNVEEHLVPLLDTEVHDLRGHCSIPEFINSRIESGYECGSFLVTNLNCVVHQLKQWRAELPMVEPFYAVKCNPDHSIIRLLASMGCNFDCATMGEVDLVLNGLGDALSFGPNGKAGTGIVYANPAKMQHMLEFAINNGVRMTVIDGEDELIKIAETPGHENLQLLLRLTTDDKASVCRFSKKFGCPVAEAPRLLDVAVELGLNIAGVSFHVGSGCGDAAAYATALDHARIVFEEGAKRGMPAMSIVDIGGGFPGGINGDGGPGMPTFHQIAATVRSSIDDFLLKLDRPASEIRFIAEPGRYFVSSSTTIATKVYSRKGGKNKYQALYVDDGVYGSFNNVVYDHALPVPKRLTSVLAKEQTKEADLIPSAVFGPTCDGLDQMCSLENTVLPRCEVGEWLIWEEQGAYTHTASFVFNGYTHIPKKTYCFL